MTASAAPPRAAPAATTERAHRCVVPHHAGLPAAADPVGIDTVTERCVRMVAEANLQRILPREE